MTLSVHYSILESAVKVWLTYIEVKKLAIAAVECNITFRGQNRLNI